jgi:uncharacterized protein (TIRG00374 family)
MENVTKKKSRKNLYFFIFIIINIIAVVIIGVGEFQGQKQFSFTEILQVWLDNWKYFIFILILPISALIIEGLKYVFMIYKTTKEFRFGLGMKVGILGKYYDNVTPLGSGGQPFQMYYLHKSGLSGGLSGSLPIAGFFFSQLAFLFVCLFAFITNGDVIKDQWFRIVAYIGLGFSFFIPLSLVAFSFLPKLSSKIIVWTIKILHKIKLVRNVEKVTTKSFKTLNDYSESIHYLATSKGNLFLTTALSILYQFTLCSIPYFAVRSFGFNIDYFDSLSMTLFTYAAISFIPTPGNSGAAEFSFAIVFSILTSAGYMFWGMMLWRFSSYYLSLLIGLSIIIIESFQTKKESRRVVLVKRNVSENKLPEIEEEASN